MLKTVVKALMVVGGAVAGAFAIKNAGKIKQQMIDNVENDEVELDEHECCGNCDNCSCCHHDEMEVECDCEDLPEFYEIDLEEFIKICNQQCCNCDADGDHECCGNCNCCDNENNEE